MHWHCVVIVCVQQWIVGVVGVGKLVLGLPSTLWGLAEGKGWRASLEVYAPLEVLGVLLVVCGAPLEVDAPWFVVLSYSHGGSPSRF